MDSAALSLTCAGLGAAQEDEDGAVIGYAKSDHCLGTAALPLSAFHWQWIRLGPISDLRMSVRWLICAMCARYLCR